MGREQPWGFAEVLADRENNFAISLEKLVLNKSANDAVFKHIKNTFQMEMNNEIWKHNNTDQVKGNAAKNSKNINGSPSFIQKFLI